MVASRVLMAVLAIVLVVALLGANVAMGLDRGALDADYVNDELESADVYETIHEEILNEIEDEVGDVDTDLPTDIDLSELLGDIVTVEYIQEQVSGAIEGLYAFLHGETDQIDIVLDLGPVIENLEDAAAAEVAAISLADIDLDPIAVPVEGHTVTVDPGALDDGEASYYAEVDRFESDAKDAIADSIESQTGQEPSDEDVDEAYEEMQDELHDDIVAVAQDTIGDAFPDEVAQEAAAIAETIASAYTMDLSHGEFDSQLESDKEALGASAASWMIDQEADLDAEFHLGDELDDEATDELSPVVTAVSIIGTLAWLLPLVALGIVAGMYAITRDPARVAKAAAVPALLVGGLCAAIAIVAPGLVEDLVLDAVEFDGAGSGLLDAIPAIVESVFAPLLMQSIALLGLGVVLLVGAIYVGRSAAADET